MELFGIGGFSFYFAYALITFYWLFTEFPTNLTGAERGVVQGFVFLGVPLAHLAVSVFKRPLSSSRVFRASLPVALVLAFVLPIEVLLEYFGITLHPALNAFGAFCAGVAGSYFTLRWLEGVGSARVHKYLIFTSLSVAGGAVLLLLVILTPQLFQPMAAVLYIVVSTFFLRFLNSRSDSTEGLPIRPKREFLPFTKEVEPSIFVYGIVFGLCFALLFIAGQQAVLFGMVAILLGGTIVFLFDLFGKSVGITITQRVVLVLTVAACLVVPLSDGVIRVAGLCLTVGAWGAFSSVNWAVLVQRSVAQKSRVFFSVASGVSVSGLGFLVGWVFSFIYAITDFEPIILNTIMFALAFLLVLVIMLFFPQSQHHEEKPEQHVEPAVLRIPVNEIGDKAVFRMRIEQVAKIYGLSQREHDVLSYLAKGRNANYIQKELTISPHTAKSHIYNIYRKLDIHSQQKLMDFIEDYPVELTSVQGHL